MRIAATSVSCLPAVASACFIVFSPATMLAADFWESKPVSEWTDKDMQKLVNNSPWAHQSKASVNNGAPNESADASLGRPPTIGSTGLPGQTPPGPADDPRLTGAGRPEAPLDSAARLGAATPEVEVTVRWLTALPMRQAQMRAKYGKEVDASPEAKRYIEQQPAYYTLSVAGLPGILVSAYGGDRAKELIQKQAVLTAKNAEKGREPIHAAAVQFVPNGANVDVLIAFPRVPAFMLADQDVDFTARIGTANIHQRFHLKDMQVHGKLEL